MKRYQNEIINALKAKDLVTESEVSSALEEAQKKDIPPTRCLIERGHITEEEVLKVLGAITNTPFVNLNEIEVDESAVKAVPAKFTWHYKFMPVKSSPGKLTVACSWPLSINVQDELRLMLGYRVDTVLAREEQIKELLNRNYGLGSDTVDKMMENETKEGAPEEKEEEVVEDIEKMAGDASVIKLVNQIIFEAYKKRATDIHIEPFRNKLRLRYRIDGVLQNQRVPERVNRFIMPILSRIKVMSNLNIVEKRLPQDGRALVRTKDGMLDLRVSFIPTQHGESVVIRILPTGRCYGLEKLGLSKEGLTLLRSLVKEPSGIIFVTGPTGSGKTTTLYACIKEINKDKRKIITIEDPIEYEMDNVIQIQVNKKAGLTFSQGLRSMLRHDPDIMMVGEVRDKETAEIAIRVALTGHLVFSTLHTNDAVGGVTRLMDIGIPPYLIAASVQAFIAQRLVRLLCPECKVVDPEPDESMKARIRRALGLDKNEPVEMCKASGCEKCGNTGFKGRTAIYEMLPVTERISRLISNDVNVSDIEDQAKKEGMRTLAESGWDKVYKGETTPEEVLKVCQDLRDPSLLPEEDREAEDPHEKKSAEPTFKVQEQAYQEDEDADRRIHKRLNIELPVQYRMIEKGEGDILRLDPSGNNKVENSKAFDDKLKGDYTELLSQSSFLHTKVAEDSFKKDIYDGSASILCNISAGGMLFESEYKVPVGSVLDVVVTVPESKEKVRSLAKVVRVEKALPRGFLVAVNFLNITGKERGLIDSFVSKELSGHFK